MNRQISPDLKSETWTHWIREDVARELGVKLGPENNFSREWIRWWRNHKTFS
ncbi:hypothetical protein P4U65_32035 [Bacillus pacificus]|nr:hypothetical protein [Bacillus pacificus]